MTEVHIVSAKYMFYPHWCRCQSWKGFIALNLSENFRYYAYTIGLDL